MSQINRLQTIDADTLQSTAYEPVSFVVDDLLPQGLHLLERRLVQRGRAVAVFLIPQDAFDMRQRLLR
jgi:hypothetical protein